MDDQAKVDGTDEIAAGGLRPSADILRSILDEQLELVCRFDGKGRILFVNRAYARVGGVEPEALIGSDFRRFVPSEERTRVEALLDALSPETPAVTIENSFVGRDGVVWIRWRNHAVDFDQSGRWTIAQATGVDITRERAAENALKASESHLRLMVDELNHRVKNTLAAVQSIARQTLRPGRPADQTIELFTARLVALSAAHNVLTRQNWEGAVLPEIVSGALDPFGVHGEGRLTATGPEVRLSARAALALAMALHELATNAAKYGALSTEAGRVELDWRLEPSDEGARLELEWRERGGPPVSPRRHGGFGSRLLTQGLPAELDGVAELDFAPDGLVCRISAPVAGPAAPETTVTSAKPLDGRESSIY